LSERAGSGTWVFARKGEGYIALFSARKVYWKRDGRFDDDPAPPPASGKMKDGRVTSTELRAEEGSNIWICVIGNATRNGTFGGFKEAVRDSYLNISGVSSLNQLECTFDVPRGRAPFAGGFRLELFDSDEEAHIDGKRLDLDEFPRFENRYVQ